MAVLTMEVNAADERMASYPKGVEDVTELRLARNSLLSAAGTLEAEIRARGHELITAEFSADPVTYDEETLMKVRRGLHHILGGHLPTDQRITDCISEIQNNGILFRERANG